MLGAHSAESTQIDVGYVTRGSRPRTGRPHHKASRAVPDREGTPARTSHRRGVGVVVIGDQRFREFVGVAAASVGREVVAEVEVTPDGAAERRDLTHRRDWGDLIVDARVVEHARLAVPDLWANARRIWVISPSDRARDLVRRAGNPLTCPLPLTGRAIKRALDIVLATIGLVLVLPILLVAMAAVRFDSSGPAIFTQTRVGANGRRFRLYKIRTMAVNADDGSHRAYFEALAKGQAERQNGLYKLVDDPRVTKTGRLLRRLSIDELPQLWNVLRGEMSLVGPRPLLPADLDLYDAEAWQRMRVKPGVTGLWQVSGRCELSFQEMVALDVRYWREWSLRLELAILLRTPMSVFAGKGAA